MTLPCFTHTLGNDGVEKARGDTTAAVRKLVVDECNVNPQLGQFQGKGTAGKAPAYNQYLV